MFTDEMMANASKAIKDNKKILMKTQDTSPDDYIILHLYATYFNNGRDVVELFGRVEENTDNGKKFYWQLYQFSDVTTVRVLKDSFAPIQDWWENLSEDETTDRSLLDSVKTPLKKSRPFGEDQ